MCIGFNLLHQIPEDDDENSSAENGEDTDYEDEWEWSGDKDGKASMDKGENYPQGKRLWSWLVLCDDGNSLLSYLQIFLVLIYNGLVNT